jgi:hypothetical protein
MILFNLEKALEPFGASVSRNLIRKRCLSTLVLVSSHLKSYHCVHNNYVEGSGACMESRAHTTWIGEVTSTRWFRFHVIESCDAAAPPPELHILHNRLWCTKSIEVMV